MIEDIETVFDSITRESGDTVYCKAFSNYKDKGKCIQLDGHFSLDEIRKIAAIAKQWEDNP